MNDCKGSGDASGARTFADLWESALEKHGPSPFLVFSGTDEVVSWTYAEFDRLVELTESALKDKGVRPGNAIHLCLKNCPGFIAVWLAAARIGAWIVPVDPHSSSRDIANQVRRTAPALGICAAERAGTYREGVGELPLQIIELTETSEDLLKEGSALLGAAPAESTAVVDPRQRLSIMFTSGTTSAPKGVELTQANYAYVGRAMAEAACLEAHHRWLVTLPLFHANAQYYCFASAIAVGASVALTARFSASRWVQQSLELDATHASLFAAPMRMILARTSEDQQRGRLQHVWFAQSLARRHHLEFAELAGCVPRQLYGMTETVAIVTHDRSEPPVHDQIGEVLGGRRAELRDPISLNPVDPGTPGIIALAGTRGEDLFVGYLDDEATTSRAFVTDDEGREWFLTGDLAVESSGGVWSFVGRVDDVIKVAGENVSLTEVEAAVAEAPGVLEAAVVPRDDETRDVVPIAYVVPRGKQVDLSPEALQDWAEKNLPPASRPREWNVIDELPRTSVGKLRRFKLAGNQ